LQQSQDDDLSIKVSCLVWQVSTASNGLMK